MGRIITFQVSAKMRPAVDAYFPPVVKSEPIPSIVKSPAEAMPPPAETVVKKGKGGGRKKAETTIDGMPKPRGKPGPKKRKLEDGSTEGPVVKVPKMGPKANQGAINAGLRALDRSGAPCRKWSKGTFTLKTFTGTVWEIPRWKAPPKARVIGQPAGSTTGSSGKENKDNSNVGSEPSNTGHQAADASSMGIPQSSPVPQQAAPAVRVSASPTVSASA